MRNFSCSLKDVLDHDSFHQSFPSSFVRRRLVFTKKEKKKSRKLLRKNPLKNNLNFFWLLWKSFQYFLCYHLGSLKRRRARRLLDVPYQNYLLCTDARCSVTIKTDITWQAHYHNTRLQGVNDPLPFCLSLSLRRWVYKKICKGMKVSTRLCEISLILCYICFLKKCEQNTFKTY